MPVRVTAEELAYFHAGGAGAVRVTTEELAYFHAGQPGACRVTEQCLVFFYQAQITPGSSSSNQASMLG